MIDDRADGVNDFAGGPAERARLGEVLLLLAGG